MVMRAALRHPVWRHGQGCCDHLCTAAEAPCTNQRLGLRATACARPGASRPPTSPAFRMCTHHADVRSPAAPCSAPAGRRVLGDAPQLQSQDRPLCAAVQRLCAARQPGVPGLPAGWAARGHQPHSEQAVHRGGSLLIACMRGQPAVRQHACICEGWCGSRGGPGLEGAAAGADRVTEPASRKLWPHQRRRGACNQPSTGVNASRG